MTERHTAVEWLAHLPPRSKVLLINPYVQDVRYPWVRWNQPVDLLKIGRLLSGPPFDCEVELIDCMLPAESGRVADRYVEDLSTGERVRTFGVLLDKSQRQLLNDLSQSWRPDYVILSTLTSYWGPRVIPAVRAALRSVIPDVQVVLTGAFAVYETERAARTRVDTIITDFFPTANVLPRWELYRSERTNPFHEDRRCRFAGITFHSEGDGAYVLDQVKAAKACGLNRFVFFVDDLFIDNGRWLKDALQSIESVSGVEWHGLCGIHPSKGTPDLWELLRRSRFRSVHLEYDTTASGDLEHDSYAEAVHVLGGHLSSGDLSGFVMVGCPGDKLDVLMRNTIDILATVGSVIPKPYTPSPVQDRPYYDDIVRHVGGRLDKLGPRAYPLGGRPEIDLSTNDFEDFFGLTTELNKKYHGRPFDLFDGSAISEAFRSSLSKGVWKLVEY